MAGNEVDKPSGYPDTWPGVAARALELGSTSWTNLARVCILLALLAGVVCVIAIVR